MYIFLYIFLDELEGAVCRPPQSKASLYIFLDELEGVVCRPPQSEAGSAAWPVDSVPVDS